MLPGGFIRSFNISAGPLLDSSKAPVNLIVKIDIKISNSPLDLTKCNNNGKMVVLIAN